jgi:hypothetical protein
MTFRLQYNLAMGLLGFGILLSTMAGFKQGRQFFTQFALRQEHRAKIALLTQAPGKIHLQTERLEQIEASLDSIRQQGVGVGPQADFPVYLQELCQRFSVRLIRFPSESTHEGDLQVLQFSLEGPFAALLQLIYQLEQVDRAGQFNSVHLHTQSLSKKGRKVQVLLAHFSLQKISFP